MRKDSGKRNHRNGGAACRDSDAANLDTSKLSPILKTSEVMMGRTIDIWHRPNLSPLHGCRATARPLESLAELHVATEAYSGV
jgi:hypothetical protein